MTLKWIQITDISKNFIGKCILFVLLADFYLFIMSNWADNISFSNRTHVVVFAERDMSFVYNPDYSDQMFDDVESIPDDDFY